MRKKVKVEFQDDRGTKYSLSVEGKLNREKVMKIIELMELMDGPVESSMQHMPDDNTFFGRLQQLIDDSFAAVEFSSSDLAREYEEKHNETVKLSTISTYLSRLTDRGYLKRQKFSNSWVYRRIYLHPEAVPSR